MILQPGQYRLLIVDDNESIHDDLKKILLPEEIDSDLAADEALLFGSTVQAGTTFQIDSAFQGKEGLDKVIEAQVEKRPYALAFVDVRMPPGWDGIETIGHIWRSDPDLQIVICTAHSDYNWHDISEHLGVSDNLVVLKKPFDIIEVSQLAHAMTAKWASMHQARLKMEELDQLVERRTSELSKANTQLGLLAAALEAAANSITITDPDGVVLWTNPAFTIQSGYSAEEVIGKSRRVFKSGVHDDRFYKEMWEVIKSCKVWRGEIVNRRKDGILRPEEMTITPVLSESGEISHFVSINQDITDRKVAESALREAEEKYRLIFEDAVVGIFQATPQGKLLNVNRAFAKMHGYENPEQMLATGSQASSRFRNPTQIFDWNSILQNRGTIRSAEIEVMCRDGAWKWVLINIRAARDDHGNVILHEGTVEDITERKLAQQQVTYLAYYDALTGLPNRLLLRDRLNGAIASAARIKKRVALLFLDLDRFKIINDSLGHSFGDLLLQKVAVRLKNEVRPEDTVARVGGDEFLIVLRDVEEIAEVDSIATRLVNSLIGDFSIQGRSLSISCSIGISLFPAHGTDAETLIKNADAAMYCAKEKGTNTLCFFTEEMNARVVERLTLESNLRSAIERDELFLVYQPQVNIASGMIIGLEALVRWQSTELGLVMPDRFIKVAESSGLMTAIGNWVLQATCLQMKQWQQDGYELVPIAVNVSAMQFRHEGFRDQIKKMLDESGLEPRFLELELTETLLLSNADVTFKVLQDLKDMGLNLVIDDFGTGYSSLSYLRQFPVSKIKIDRTFVRDIGSNPDDTAIAIAIISMSKGLNLKVLAEGVENETQLSFLRHHNCDEYQGFYFSPPLSAEDLACLLRKPMAIG